MVVETISLQIIYSKRVEEGIYIDARGVPLLGESNVVKNAALISALKSYDVTRPPYSKKYSGWLSCCG